MPGWRRHLGAAGVVAGALILARLTRYEIAEQSMQPALSAGDWTLGIRHPSRVSTGDVVVVEMPGRPGFEIVKRVAAVGGETLETPEGDMTVAAEDVWVLGDDPAAGSVDSRHFGPVPRQAVRARLVLRYQPLPIKRVG